MQKFPLDRVATFVDFLSLRQEKENGVYKVDDDKSDYESDWEAEIDPQGEVFHIQPMPEFTASPEIPLKSRKIKHFNYFTSFQKRSFFLWDSGKYVYYPSLFKGVPWFKKVAHQSPPPLNVNLS